MKVKASQKCQASKGLKSRFLQVTKKGQKGRGRMKKRSLHYFKLLCWCIPADWMRKGKKNCNWTWKTFFPCRCTTVIVPLFGGHYKSWVRPLDKEKKFISSVSAPRPRILCMVYPLSMPQPSSHQFVLPRPLFILRWKPWWSFHTVPHIVHHELFPRLSLIN